MSKPKFMSSDVREYLETVLWSAVGDDGVPLEEDFGVSDFSAKAVRRAEVDLEKFQRQAGDMNPDPHDFWLTRNRHGSGFWSKPEKYGADAKKLTDLAHAAGEVFVYVGDDGLLYFA